MRSRKSIHLLLGLTAVAAFTPAVESREPRRETMPYTPFDNNHSVGLPGHGPGPQISGEKYTFELHKGERYVSVAIVDENEMGVASAIAQWRPTGDYDAGSASAHTYRLVMIHHFCNFTEEPVRVYPKYDFDVWIKQGTCEDGTPSTPTSGKILADIYGR